MVGAIEDEDESVGEESVCKESEDGEGTIQYALRSPAKLYAGGAGETFVRQKETKRHRSPNKIVKHVGIEYMHTKKNRERAMKRRVEGTKLKVKELRVVTGIHTKLEFYKENDDRKPDIATKQQFATSPVLLSNTVTTTVPPIEVHNSSWWSCYCRS